MHLKYLIFCLIFSHFTASAVAQRQRKFLTIFAKNLHDFEPYLEIQSNRGSVLGTDSSDGRYDPTFTVDFDWGADVIYSIEFWDDDAPVKRLIGNCTLDGDKLAGLHELNSLGAYTIITDLTPTTPTTTSTTTTPKTTSTTVTTTTRIITPETTTTTGNVPPSTTEDVAKPPLTGFGLINKISGLLILICMTTLFLK